MKHLSTHFLSAVCFLLALTLLLAGCGGTGSTSGEPKDYAQILRDARDAEFNDAYSIITSPEEDTFGIMEAYGFDPDAMEQYAISISIMNTQAYAVMIVQPKEGQADTIKTAMQDFIQRQSDSFEFYLEDQYAIAQDARLETEPSGELVLVMSEDASTVLEKIENALK